MYFYKRLLLLVLLLSFFCINSVFAGDHSIHIEWGYTPPSEPAVIGFKLYKEGVASCQVMSSTSTAMDCYVSFSKEQTAFTLTALFSDGTESPHSAPFIFTLPPEDVVVIPPTGNTLVTFTLAEIKNPSVKSNRMYVNSKLICENFTTSEKNISCTTDLPAGQVIFNVRQLYLDGTESNPSNSLIYNN